ncbi:MAG: DUF2750 domain-containing protein [Hyphomicrobiaceae bacterium]
MHRTPSIPEIAQRGRFIKRALEQQSVYAISDQDDLASVASQQFKDVDVILLWSQEREAVRWADAIAKTPKIETLTVAELLTDILPSLSQQNRVVGLDWSASPVEGEFNSIDIAERLRGEAIEGFVKRARRTERIFILENSVGPALMQSAANVQKMFMPVWSDHDSAQLSIKGPWADMVAMEIPISNFLGLTLPWLAEQGWTVGPDFVHGARTLELAPRDLASRLSVRSVAA